MVSYMLVRIRFGRVIVSTLISAFFASVVLPILAAQAHADGLVIPPRDYKGSLEEKAQEAILVFHASDQPGESTQDMILKIDVAGDAESFAWVVPFPNEPEIAKEDSKLFKELFDYVESQQYALRKTNSKSDNSGALDAVEAAAEAVGVISRQVVGDFEIAVVREHEEGGLNPWLEAEGFQTLDDADDVLKFYREKKYVFACIKVSSKALATQGVIESHPLRFTFSSGGRDGIYFPMKMTGLQSEPFDVNLYVFYRAWLNDRLSRFGYRHRGFELNYRDWDSPRCVANGGKSYSLPEDDSFLSHLATRIPRTKAYFQKLHPGEKYYLTNIRARNLSPADVRQWPDDLWLFPYYTDRSRIPYDARPGGPAHDAYPNVPATPRNVSNSSNGTQDQPSIVSSIGVRAAVPLLLVAVFVAFTFVARRHS